MDLDETSSQRALITQYLNYDLMDVIKYTLENDRCLHQFKWKQKVELLLPSQYKTILDMLSIKSKNKFDEDINTAILKILILNWEDVCYFDVTLVDPKKIHQNLIAYLKNNIGRLKKIVMSKIIYEGQKDVDECLVVECPLKVLKTLFNSRFGVEDNSEIYEFEFKDLNKVDANISPQSFTNWPHTGMRFSFNGFEMIHENFNHLEFNVINIENKSYKPKVRSGLDTSLYFEPNECREYYESKVISDHLMNLRARIMKKTCDLIPLKKVELITFLNEMNYDVRLAVKDVGVGVTYFANFFPSPYVRYMANTNHNHQQRGRVTKNDITMRLQQVAYPAVKFRLIKFNPTFDSGSISKSTLTKSLTYYCTLCEEKFETTVYTDMANHVTSLHGSEAGYVCVLCDRSFPVKTLSGNRWTHACTPRF